MRQKHLEANVMIAKVGNHNKHLKQVNQVNKQKRERKTDNRQT